MHGMVAMSGGMIARSRGTRSITRSSRRSGEKLYAFAMTTYICFLRGVNVGGNNLLKMAELKLLFDALRLRDAKTYLQSGNVVFRSDEKDREVLKRRIEDGIRKKWGVEVKIVLRTTDELRKVIAANPLPEDCNPKALLVAFLGGP